MNSPEYKVLVVDDNPATRRGLTLLLSLEHDVVEVFEAEGWKQAEKMVQDELPNVVLLDVRMPGMSGIEITRRIKAWDSRIHVVAMSMVAESGPMALKAGADMFVEKSQLVSDIRAVLCQDESATKRHDAED